MLRSAAGGRSLLRLQADSWLRRGLPLRAVQVTWQIVILVLGLAWAFVALIWAVAFYSSFESMNKKEDRWHRMP